jgi:hypothetical protein
MSFIVPEFVIRKLSPCFNVAILNGLRHDLGTVDACRHQRRRGGGGQVVGRQVQRGTATVNEDFGCGGIYERKIMIKMNGWQNINKSYIVI